MSAGDIFRFRETDLIRPSDKAFQTDFKYAPVFTEPPEHKYVTRRAGNHLLCSLSEGAMLSLEQMHNLGNRLPPPVPNTDPTVCRLPSRHALSHSHYQHRNTLKLTSAEVSADATAQVQQYRELGWLYPDMTPRED